ncbi:uncharacterized protein LOC133187305 [Saccostrea echinata]|uniref:uncharacterized protein LOC133187305 n=1 Tax=Saccostrea echinata TaxID=191078 RepID=UPI002A7EE3DD|nr:uncharacterized protein LOC133187305 [Saccostrea echinata]
MEAPPPSYQEAVNSEPSTSSSFTIIPSQSSPESSAAGGHVSELCVCPQHGIVPRLNVCICGRDGFQSGAIQTTSCQHCSNYVIVQRHYFNTHAPNSDTNIHSRNEISEEHCDQSVSNDVSVHFDSAKGTVSSLISEPEREPMLSDANRLTGSGEDEEGTEGACANCNTGSFCAASFLAIFVIILITVFTFYLT